jgi:protein-S-isoprenylcysteine O-methyltransferase Ste14
MKYLRAVAFMLITVLIYLGVPLLGWGITDLPGFLSATPRLLYAALVIAFGLAVGVQAVDAPEGIRGSRGDERKLVGRQHIVRRVVVLALYVSLAFLPFADRRAIGVLGDAALLRWIGLILAALGLGLVFWSGVALGRMYSQEVTIQEGHRLVTDGPYRFVRHPRYAGVIGMAVGLSLLFRSWIGLAVVAPLVAVLLFRIRDEEALMHREFGPEWEAYCRRSWRLAPLVF